MNRNKWNYGKLQREDLTNCKTLDFTKVDSFLGLIYKFFPILLIYFVYFDYSVFINVFNIESGYFYTIFTNNLFSSLGLIFIYILIPIILVSTLFLFGIVSLDISQWIQTHILKKNRVNFENIGIYEGTFTLIFIVLGIFALFSTLLFVANYFKNISFLGAFTIVIFIYIFIRGVLGSIYLYLGNSKFKDNGCYKWLDGLKWTQVLDIAILLVLGLYIYMNRNNGSIVFIFIFYYSYHLFSYGYYENYIQKNYVSIRYRKKDNFKYIIRTFLFVFIFFAYLDHINLETWKKPITVNKEKKAFKDSNFNLIFNRGLLLNNKNTIKIKISKTYFSYIDIDSIDYLSIYADKNDESYITYKIRADAQYLNLTNNLKIYFQPANNRTIVFLVEEKKFANKNGSEYILVELSDYEIEKNN